MFTTLDPSSIAELWRRARAMFERAAAIIGRADTLATLTALSPERRREIVGWLALVETIVRKLIFAKAALLPRLAPNSAPRVEYIALRGGYHQVRLKPPSRPAKACAFDPAQPHAWRAPFDLALPRDRLTCPESRAPRIRALWGPPPSPPPLPRQRAERQSTPAPRRLALRLEALRRVLADPAPYVRRLAARLKPKLAERYALATACSDWFDRADARLGVEVIALALLAAPIFANSS
jgi:hypothetical protein